MKMLIVSHASFERPGSIKEWAVRNEYQVQEVTPYTGEKLPEVNNFDFVVIMGGPQSPLSLDAAPYLRDEIELIKNAITLNKKMVGVCLGAQLIGEALGAKTEQSPSREIGSYPVSLLESAKDDPVFSKLPQSFNVMHWHNDMPGIADGAVLIGKSEGCPRQIYRYGDRVYGFQCHFELTKELVKELISNCPNDLNPGQFVMTVDQLMNVNYAEMNAKFDAVLDHLAQLPNLNLNSQKSVELTIQPALS